jgi:methyl-galactoside transport system permease protein
MTALKKFDLKKFLANNVLNVIMILMIIVIACISPKFLSLRVLRDILNQSASRIVVAMGCMFIIVSGGADLSGGRMVGLAAVISGTLAQQSTYYLKFWQNLPELPAIIPVLVAVLVGGLVGAFNGVVVAKFKVPAFLATLGTQMIAYGANCLYFNKAPNNSQPLAGFRSDFSAIGTGNIFGVTYLILISFVVMIAVYVLQTKTCLGREIFAVGGNPEAARVSGINVFKITMVTYILAGACYGLAGCMEAARTGSASSSYGNGYELDAIASCIVGGCSITGGIGTVPGVFLGVIIFNVINYGLTFIGLSSYWQYVVKGGIIIFAIALDMRKYNGKT